MLPEEGEEWEGGISWAGEGTWGTRHISHLSHPWCLPVAAPYILCQELQGLV